MEFKGIPYVCRKHREKENVKESVQDGISEKKTEKEEKESDKVRRLEEIIEKLREEKKEEKTLKMNKQKLLDSNKKNIERLEKCNMQLNNKMEVYESRVKTLQTTIDAGNKRIEIMKEEKEKRDQEVEKDIKEKERLIIQIEEYIKEKDREMSCMKIKYALYETYMERINGNEKSEEHDNDNSIEGNKGRLKEINGNANVNQQELKEVQAYVVEMEKLEKKIMQMKEESDEQKKKVKEYKEVADKRMDEVKKITLELNESKKKILLLEEEKDGIKSLNCILELENSKLGENGNNGKVEEEEMFSNENCRFNHKQSKDMNKNKYEDIVEIGKPLCMYKENCTKAKCSHPEVRKVERKGESDAIGEVKKINKKDGSFNVKRNLPCWYGNNCKRRSCIFSHQRKVQRQMNNDRKFVSDKKRWSGIRNEKKRIPCRYKNNCRRMDCWFIHPSDEQKDENAVKWIDKKVEEKDVERRILEQIRNQENRYVHRNISSENVSSKQNTQSNQTVIDSFLDKAVAQITGGLATAVQQMSLRPLQKNN